MGRAMRATAQDPEAARLMGINVNKTISLTFLLGGVLAGAAGLVYALYETNIWYFQGFKAGLIAFTAAVMGGIGNIRGAVLGGLIIGVIQSFVRQPHRGRRVDRGGRVRLPDPDHGAAARAACSARRRGRPDERPAQATAGSARLTPAGRVPPQLREWRRDRPRAAAVVATGLAVALIVLGIVLPFAFSHDSGFMNATIIALAYVVMSLGLNVVVGFAGLLDLGYVAFYALGAYSLGWFGSDFFFKAARARGRDTAVAAHETGIHLNFLLILVAAAVICALAGIVIGLPTLRLRGDYIAIVTLAFGEIIGVVAVNGTTSTSAAG